MKPIRVVMVVGVFLLGAVAGVWASKRGPLGPELFTGVKPKEAAANLLAVSRKLAKDGSWERIAVGRVHYLAGDKAAGQAIFDEVMTGRKPDAGDYFRLGKVYFEANEWEKAKGMFDKVLEMKPKDQDWLAQIGAYYILKGDRAKGEELVTRSFAGDSENLYNSLRVAGAYVGVRPD